ncbi:MAG: hypothetical protein ACD_44C00151G0004 [uncultured bacterium]|nr:MAG: hypothetical protein ACD_44C00151G0004 [uncultured bacterium]OGT23742.1 MAG: hypothetical protein A2W47_06355 [Gammaproteobacteria bacterium RIFCSPHIGHO2_12_38_15]OGT66897.1 MAG: hypothetical protein A3I12_02305 [Gammaproteobacteria bacterium RIFCSPLOWO2_02_FULL_38_11]OGT75835.1 MAG: hypothetical protein A3G71_03065 [Gammaproteobacteria bacterium RIFCSPLOWO2_12_FULL_38_14]
MKITLPQTDKAREEFFKDFRESLRRIINYYETTVLNQDMFKQLERKTYHFFNSKMTGEERADQFLKLLADTETYKKTQEHFLRLVNECNVTMNSSSKELAYLIIEYLRTTFTITNEDFMNYFSRNTYLYPKELLDDYTNNKERYTLFTTQLNYREELIRSLKNTMSAFLVFNIIPELERQLESINAPPSPNESRSSVSSSSSSLSFSLSSGSGST